MYDFHFHSVLQSAAWIVDEARFYCYDRRAVIPQISSVTLTIFTPNLWTLLRKFAYTSSGEFD